MRAANGGSVSLCVCCARAGHGVGVTPSQRRRRMRRTASDGIRRDGRMRWMAAEEVAKGRLSRVDEWPESLPSMLRRRRCVGRDRGWWSLAEGERGLWWAERALSCGAPPRPVSHHPDPRSLQSSQCSVAAFSLDPHCTVIDVALAVRSCVCRMYPRRYGTGERSERQGRDAKWWPILLSSAPLPLCRSAGGALSLPLPPPSFPSPSPSPPPMPLPAPVRGPSVQRCARPRRRGQRPWTEKEERGKRMEEKEGQWAQAILCQRWWWCRCRWQWWLLSWLSVVV